jgi:hypothetical protein
MHHPFHSQMSLFKVQQLDNCAPFTCLCIPFLNRPVTEIIPNGHVTLASLSNLNLLQHCSYRMLSQNASSLSKQQGTCNNRTRFAILAKSNDLHFRPAYSCHPQELGIRIEADFKLIKYIQHRVLLI